MSSTAISVIRYRSSSGLILASDLASSWARSSGERSIKSADQPLYTNWASGAKSWRDRWVNRRWATHACNLKFSRAAGAVVLRTEVLELIQYRPQTAQVREVPLAGHLRGDHLPLRRKVQAYLATG